MKSSSGNYLSIQPSVLRDAVGGDEATFLQLLHTFLRIAPPMVEYLEQAACSADLAKSEAKGHDLKGTAKLVGAERLAALAGEMEARARQGESEKLPDLIVALREEFNRVMAEIAACAVEARNAAASGTEGA